jgi:hypothetical protein
MNKENDRQQLIRHVLAWERHGWYEIKHLPRKSNHAVIIGAGPSLSQVSAEEWEALRGAFCITVNSAATWLSRYGPKSWNPDVALFTRAPTDKEREEQLFTVLAGLRANAVAVIIGDAAAASIGSHARWICPLRCGHIGADPGEGLTLTIEADDWARGSIAAVHLAGLMEFEEIGLLGIDHQGEGDKASIAYSKLARWLRNRGTGLTQLGQRSAWTAQGVAIKGVEPFLSLKKEPV